MNRRVRTATKTPHLHGASMGFVLPAEAWWPRFWALASVLITAQDREIADLVGYERTSVVDQHLEQNTKNVEHRTEALIARARQRLAQYEAGTLPAKVQAQWNADPDQTRSGQLPTSLRWWVTRHGRRRGRRQRVQ